MAVLAFLCGAVVSPIVLTIWCLGAKGILKISREVLTEAKPRTSCDRERIERLQKQVEEWEQFFGITPSS